jgi:hypothetical protein
MIPPGGWKSADCTGNVTSSPRYIAGASLAISSGYISRESIPISRLTSARSAMTKVARSEWASVRWPDWENRRLNSSSRERPS